MLRWSLVCRVLIKNGHLQRGKWRSQVWAERDAELQQSLSPPRGDIGSICGPSEPSLGGQAFVLLLGSIIAVDGPGYT